MIYSSSRVLVLAAAVVLLLCRPASAATLEVPPAAHAVLDQIYSGDLASAFEGAHRLQQDRPGHPLGYLLEAEALWWRVWCTSAEFKYGMTYPRRHPKVPADQRYFELAAKVSSLATERLATAETAESHFYAAMGDALTARLYGLRSENRATARYGVRSREHFLRALALDPSLADADFGLGLYNYYIDTLSGFARVLRFFMGIPGGNKQDGIRQLEHSIAQGAITPPEARFYLAISLHNFDHKYQQALDVAGPLLEKYPSNPLFHLIVGDLHAKLGNRAAAAERYRTAATLPFGDPECRPHIQDLVRDSLSTIGASPN